MKKIIIALFLCLMIAVIAVPALSLAQENKGLVPCGKTDDSGKITNPCDFNDLMTLINKVIKFVLFDLALPIAAIMFAYAGFKLVTSGGSTEARSTAKSIFTNTAIGLILAVLAWLIVRTILHILGYDGEWIGF